MNNTNNYYNSTTIMVAKFLDNLRKLGVKRSSANDWYWLSVACDKHHQRIRSDVDVSKR